MCIFVIFGILAIIVIATNYVRNKNTQENIQMESNVTKELNEVQELAETLLEEIAAYRKKNTKAASLRIRKLLNELRKKAPIARAALLEADKMK